MIDLLADNPLTHVVPHGLFGTEYINNHMLMQVVAVGLLLWILPRAVRAQPRGDVVEDLTPHGLANFFEAICSYLRTQVARPVLGEHTDRFIPYVWTAFFFVLVSNLLGLIPIDAFIGLGGRASHIGGTSTGNIFITGALAVCTMFMIVYNGLRLSGTAYLAHFCPGPMWLAPLLIPVEIVGLVAKIFALAVRLFANMVAGHVLLAVLVGFVGAMSGWAGRIGVAIPVIIGSVAITLLELFVAFLQAFIFTFLTTLFIGQAVVLHHGDEHGGHDQ